MYAGAVAVPLILVSSIGLSQEDFGSSVNIALAFGTLLVTLAINRTFRGFVRRISVLLGLIIGTAVAAIFGVATFREVVVASWFGITTPFYFGLPTFGFAAILS